MNDTISRQEAIDVVEFGITYAKAIDVNTGESKELFKEGNDALKKAVERLKELPSAEPERKTGKWKRAYLDREAMGERPSIFYCSVCNQCIAYPVNYCPSCGADMRGEEDED